MKLTCSVPLTEHGRSLRHNVLHILLELEHAHNHFEEENHLGDCRRSEYLDDLPDFPYVLVREIHLIGIYFLVLCAEKSRSLSRKVVGCTILVESGDKLKQSCCFHKDNTLGESTRLRYPTLGNVMNEAFLDDRLVLWVRDSETAIVANAKAKRTKKGGSHGGYFGHSAVQRKGL